MVLESLTNPFKAEDKPWNLLLLGAVYASAGLFLGNWIFREYASLIMVFLTVMACIPLLYNTFRSEEEKEVRNMLKIQIHQNQKFIKIPRTLVRGVRSKNIASQISKILHQPNKMPLTLVRGK